MSALLERCRRSKIWRAWSRYGCVRGNVLAGGIAFFGFFSFFPALALGFTTLGLVVGNRPDLQRQVVDYVNSTFGGATIIGTASRPGLVTMEQLTSSNVLTVVGVLGLIGALLTGLGWIGALRDAISAIFRRGRGPNPLVAKLGDLGALVSFGLAALASMVASLLVSTGTGLVLDWLGLRRGTTSAIGVNVLTSLLVLVIDTGLFLLFFRLLAGVRVPVEDLVGGALVGGVALGLLKVLGAVLIRYASGNRFFAAFVIVAGLLLWLNLAARAGLVAAAWAATTAEDRGHLATVPGAGGAVPADRPPTPAGHRARAVGVAGTPTYSARAADRATLLAGAVLGITLAVAARVVAGAGGTLRAAIRDGDQDPGATGQG
ncbi:MAG TPA: YhjD/YihY/BrkB family envelope integrity protein [Kineosporiaceae bacterium]